MSAAKSAAGGIRVFAPAKVNLYLHVLGRRADGYHELDSLVAFADIGDVVTAAPGPGLSLAVDGPFAAELGPAEDNLVLRAARALAAQAGRAPQAALRLTKILPVASGIGGGSSDAAAALRALAALWQVALPEGGLAALAAGLGADVPVCLAGAGAAWLGGAGEQVAAAPALPAAGIVLVNPGRALATPAVFRARTGPFSPPARFTAAPADAASLAALLAERRNDLAAPAQALVPEIGAVLDALACCPGALLNRMSGSGATCFALFATRRAAERAAATLAADHPAWWIAAGELLARPVPA